MNHQDRITTLLSRHKQLEHEIERLGTATENEAQIKEMKKQKLALLDEVARLQRLIYEEQTQQVNLDDDR